MTAATALKIIRSCVSAGRVILKDHFVERMAQRGMFWSDVLAIIDAPRGIRTDGDDKFGRQRWFIAGDAPDGLRIEILCVIDEDEPTTIFITIYWE